MTNRGTGYFQGFFGGGGEGSYRGKGEREGEEDAAEDIIMAVETDREPGQKGVMIYSTCL